MTDLVNLPPHYRQGDIECIDAIRASMSQGEFEAYLKGQVIKYLWRYQHKGTPLQDVQKAQWCLNRLEKEIKNCGEKEL